MANLFKTLLLAAMLVAETAGALLRSDSGILARGIFCLNRDAAGLFG